jgi:outer membrane protein assembly factor BamE (lipoprotein component of BamABCDE complex)
MLLQWRMRGTVVAAALAALLAGCATTTNVGREVDQAAAAQLQPGITTVDQAQRLLGPPLQRVEASNGKTVLTYAHSTVTQHGLFGSSADVATQSLVLVFGPDGKLIRSTTGSSSTPDQQ